MQADVTDEVLIKRIVKGDTPAFRTLVLRYQNLVFTLALRIVGKREDAEETAQDVFMKVYSNIGNFRGTAKFSSWLYRITYNTALTKIRNAKPLVSLSEDENTQTVYNEAENIFNAADVNKAIAMLGTEDAAIITLFYLAEQNLEEISQALSIETNAAKVRLFRARKKLREIMEPVSSSDSKHSYLFDSKKTAHDN